MRKQIMHNKNNSEFRRIINNGYQLNKWIDVYFSKICMTKITLISLSNLEKKK